MLLGKGVAGAVLEIFFKLSSFLLLLKPDRRRDFPGDRFCGKRGFARVMVGQPCFQVAGQPDVFSSGMASAFHQVDIHDAIIGWPGFLVNCDF